MSPAWRTTFMPMPPPPAAGLINTGKPTLLAAADSDALIAALGELVRAGDHVVFMSNGGFDGAPRRFLAVLP